jgi:molybdopterin molybdotransferase
MVSVEEAARIIFSRPFKCETEKVPVSECIGRVLAESIQADRPFPPFDRVAMDGIAIAFDSYSAGNRKFGIEDTQAAGQPRKQLKNATHCLEVMTGAILPAGTDTVIRFEDLNKSSSEAEIVADITRGQNIHRKGIDADENETLLEPGVKLSSAEVALLASVGKAVVSVFAFPPTAVISTGDELVDVSDVPLPYQIRRSNGYAIQSAMREMGWKAEMFHICDDREILQRTLEEILGKFDVLILSGGVSKGKFDFVPDVLQSAGIRREFHQVNQRPGRPFWFGRSAEGKVAFALPGNPVSTFMCFYKYIRPWMMRSLGCEPEDQKAILKHEFSFPPKLTFFLQVRVINENGSLLATPLAGGGSGDFANLKDVTGFLELPPDRSDFRAGEIFPYIPFRR